MQPARDNAQTHPKSSRRALFAGGTAALLAAAVTTAAHSAPVETGTDAELLALAAEFWRHNDKIEQWNAGRIQEAEGERHNCSWWDCCRAMTGIVPQTAAGRQAKAAVALVALEGVQDCQHDVEALVRAVLAENGGRAARSIGPDHPPIPAPDPDAELVAICAEFVAADADLRASDAASFEDDEVSGAINRRWYGALDRLTPIQARTQAGRRAKADAAYLALKSTGIHGDQREETLALAALAELTGRASA